MYQSSLARDEYPVLANWYYKAKDNGSNLEQNGKPTKARDQLTYRTSSLSRLSKSEYDDGSRDGSSQVDDYDKITFIPTVTVTRHFELLELSKEIKSLERLSDGWDGEDSVAPGEEKVRTALNVIENWPLSLGVPTVEPDIDGNIIIEVLDRENNEMVGVDVVGSEVVFCSVLRNGGVLYQKRTASADLSDALEAIKDTLA